MSKNLFFLLIIFSSHISFSQLKLVPDDEILHSDITRIQTFAFETYSAENAESFPKLTPLNATEKLLSIHNYKSYSTYINAISNTYGFLKKVELAEVLKDSNFSFVYRFKGMYSKTADIAEIRIYTNSENKFDEIIFKPIWFNEYYEKDEKPPLSKIEMDSIYKFNAFQFANKTFKDCQKGNFLKLNDGNATRRLSNSLSNQKLELFCEKLTMEFGELDNFKLIEILSDGYRIIYRYMAQFSKSINPLELRVYTNLEHKFAGIYCKEEWLDKFYEDHEKG